nr:hypothetical protein [Tanacetum cinerariifolium]
MIKPEKPLKKKYQIMIDEEVTRNLEAQLQAELKEEERLARQKEEEANIALIAKWDDVQAMMDTDHELVKRLQAEEQGKISSYHIIRHDGSSKRFSSMIQMLQNIDRKDLETLWKLVKAKYRNTRPEEAYERMLCGDLKVMFEPDIETLTTGALMELNTKLSDRVLDLEKIKIAQAKKIADLKKRVKKLERKRRKMYPNTSSLLVL